VTISFGFGAFHTGIQIFGWEISFGYLRGIDWAKPKLVSGAVFRKCIKLGITSVTVADLSRILEDMRQNYRADTYDILNQNCNHFTNDLAHRLLGTGIPNYVNKLAKFGGFIALFLPQAKEAILNNHSVSSETKQAKKDNHPKTAIFLISRKTLIKIDEEVIPQKDNVKVVIVK